LEEDAEVGAAADRELTKSVHTYSDPKLTAYVTSVAARVGAAVNGGPKTWTARILDSSYVTVRSAPGGYLYLTRSTLAHFGSEAELAGAFAHEAAHVVERHYLTGPRFMAEKGIQAGDMSALPAVERLQLLSKLRDDERTADKLAVGYLERAGYAPQGLSRVIELFAEIERRAGGHPIPALLRTHPETSVRLAALASAPETGEWNKDEYLDQIDGLLFGDDPRNGYLYGKRYINPNADLELELGPLWRAQLIGRDLVAAVPNTSTVLVLSKSEHPGFDETRTAMGSTAPPVTQGGLRVAFDSAAQEGGLVAKTAIIDSSDGVLVLIVVLPKSDADGPVASGVISSLKQISEPHLRAIKPLRVRLTKLERAQTLRALDADKPSRTSLSTLALLNRVDPDAELPAGTRVKRIDQ
jgi:predicted Zn-dependent protease